MGPFLPAGVVMTFEDLVMPAGYYTRQYTRPAPIHVVAVCPGEIAWLYPTEFSLVPTLLSQPGRHRLWCRSNASAYKTAPTADLQQVVVFMTDKFRIRILYWPAGSTLEVRDHAPNHSMYVENQEAAPIPDGITLASSPW